MQPLPCQSCKSIEPLKTLCTEVETIDLKIIQQDSTVPLEHFVKCLLIRASKYPGPLHTLLGSTHKGLKVNRFILSVLK